MIVTASGRRAGWAFTRRGLLDFGAAAAVFSFVILPWHAELYRRSGKVSISSATTLGVNLWKGNNPYFFQFYPLVDIDQIEDRMRKEIGRNSLETAESDLILQKRAFEFISRYPLAFLKRTAAKAILFFSPAPIPYGSGALSEDRGQIRVTQFRLINPVLLLSYTLFSSLIYTGWFLLLRAWPSLTTLGRTFIACTAMNVLLNLALHTIMFHESRFRLPLEPLLLIGAAFAFVYELCLRQMALREHPKTSPQLEGRRAPAESPLLIPGLRATRNEKSCVAQHV